MAFIEPMQRNKPNITYFRQIVLIFNTEILTLYCIATLAPKHYGCIMMLKLSSGSWLQLSQP